MMASRGTTTQRKDGRWQGKLQMPKNPLTGKAQKPKYVYSESLPESKRKLDENGKPVFKNGKGKQEVERKMEALIRQIEAGDLSDVYKMTVEGWLKKYIEVYCSNCAVTTLEGYNRYIKTHINPALGKIKLCELKPIHLQNFYNLEREKKYSEKTILQEHRILHRAFKKASGDGMLRKNPCDGVDAPSPVEYVPEVYGEEEFLLLLDKLKGNRMEVPVLIAGMCGLRRGELMGLTWEDIDLENEIISVERNVVPTENGNLTKAPKTRRSTRAFNIPSGIIPRLKQLRGIGNIYVRLNGQEYDPGSISSDFGKFLKANGLRHTKLHDLRHFNGTMMNKYGVTDRVSSERLGHSNLMMTKKYQSVLKEMDKSSADKLNGILKTK